MFYIKLYFGSFTPGRLSLTISVPEVRAAWLLEGAWFKTLICLDLPIAPPY